MQKKLPKVLMKEPLVDALFEVRLQLAGPPLADILPGFLLHEINPKPAITRLPAADVPHPIRASAPNFQFTPLQRLDLGEYYVSIGDRIITVSCKLPYPKWANFKAKILDVMNSIVKAGIEGKVDRYSVKYVNLVQAPTCAEQIQKIKMKIQLGEVNVTDAHISLQVHQKEEDLLHIMSVVTNAQGRASGGNHVSGVIVDIDSIRMINSLNFSSFVAGLEQGVEELRQANKIKFFNCLTDETIMAMEPVYD
ncbi:MAG: TIGR04255 family protein [Robiginitomaculum sp.]|nr:TIGR04255 family protein [Robiginitomaculum sp.]